MRSLKAPARKCKLCGTEFVTKKWTQLFCSRSCSARNSAFDRNIPRFCSICGIAIRGAGKDLCGVCKRKARKAFLASLPVKVKKKCRVCETEKPLSEFPSDKRYPDGHEVRCNDCRTRTRNPEVQLRSSKKRRSTPKGKLNSIMSVSIRKHILSGSKNGRHWENLVGYTVGQLMKHLQKKFKPGMSWDNYGKEWHIDHFDPLSAFNFEKPEDKDFKIAWGLKNLRPLWSKENLQKGSKPLRSVQRSFVFPKGKRVDDKELRFCA
jgi:hypothetical protein